PEIIYLNPIASNGQYSFQYYVDRDSTANGALTANGTDTTGNVYFKSTSASRVVSITASIDGGSVSLGASSSSGNEMATTMGGYSTTYADKMITWTCKYIDRVSGKEMTATAFTRCVAMPKATAGSTVISASAQAGYDSKWHTDTNIGVTGWIVGATSVEARAYTITSQSSGNVDNGSVGDGRGGYKNNYLENPTNVPTNGADNISDLYNESYNGGSGYYVKSGDVNWTTGGKGTLYIDSSRYTSLGQIPQLYVGIDCNYRKDKSADMILYYDWYSNGASTTPTTYTAASQNGVSTGNTQRGIKLWSATFSSRTTTTNTLVLHPWSKSYGDSNRVGQATCYLVCQFRDKTILREAYELMMKNSTSLQQAYFTDSAWSTFTSYRNYIYNYLLNPNSTESQANLETYGKNLYNQVSKMVACVKADAGSTTASYTTYDKTTATVNRSDVLKTGTARVYHRYINGGSGSSTTTAALNAAVDGTTNVETKTYYYGETVSTGYNDTKGYSYFGYYRNEGTTQWTSPANGDLIANAPGPNKYGSSGDNSDILVAVPNLTYTYVYHKQDLSVCKDYGDSIQNLGAVQNLANLSSASFNASYGDWGASGGTATVSGTSATGFSFSVTKVGASGERYFNDIYITNAATGLTAGGTYTIAFKSDLDYDDMAWYGNEFNSASGWKQNHDYRYTPGSMALYVLTTSQGTKALQKVDTSYSTGGTVASFTLPSGTTAVNLVLRIFSDGTEMYDGTITDFKIAEGQYVYEGVEGDSVTFDTPTRIGYTFQGWIEESSPFDGTLSGTLNTTYIFGCGNDVVLANWKANTYIVTFDPNSGTCSLASKPVIFDDEYGALPQPEKTGYTYTGWYTAKDGGEKIVTTTIVKTPNDHTLYAQWKANTYAVYFNANGGTCATPSKIVTYDATYGDLPV
ncbi:MAG: InlB B-repeat-containing protein, partial [Acutalibacteraceae bacterium]